VTDYASAGDEPRSSLKDVYEQMILPDFEYAYEKLNIGIIPNVSVDKYVAAAYIGKMCNYLAACNRYGTGAAFVAEQPLNDFEWVDEVKMSQRAKEVLEDVCLNSSYILNEDFRVNFLEADKEDQYKECLMVSENVLSGSEGYWPNSFYMPTMVSADAWPTAYGGRHIPTYRIFYMYSKKDARRDWNFTGRAKEGCKEWLYKGYTYAIPTYQDSTQVWLKDAEGNNMFANGGQVVTKRVIDGVDTTSGVEELKQFNAEDGSKDYRGFAYLNVYNDHGYVLEYSLAFLNGSCKPQKLIIHVPANIVK
jgi:hypothetical protein